MSRSTVNPRLFSGFEGNTSSHPTDRERTPSLQVSPEVLAKRAADDARAARELRAASLRQPHRLFYFINKQAGRRTIVSARTSEAALEELTKQMSSLPPSTWREVTEFDFNNV